MMMRAYTGLAEKRLKRGLRRSLKKVTLKNQSTSIVAQESVESVEDDDESIHRAGREKVDELKTKDERPEERPEECESYGYVYAQGSAGLETIVAISAANEGTLHGNVLRTRRAGWRSSQSTLGM